MDFDFQKLNFRFQGLNCFSEEQSNCFFGRELEKEKLSTLLQLEKNVVLYGNAGHGKTSLIKAGLMPNLLEKEPTLKIQCFRFGICGENDKKSLTSIVVNNLLFETHTVGKFYLDKIPNQEKSIWYYLKKSQWHGKQSNFVLIFDEFEEFFSYPEAEQNKLKTELSTLLYTKIPQFYRDLYKNASDEDAGVFIDEELEWFYNPLSVRILISIRTDMLSQLNKLKDAIPGILQNCFEILPFTKSQIINILHQINEFKLAGNQIEFPTDVINEIPELIHSDGIVEPYRFQLYCRCVEELAMAVKSYRIEMNDLPSFTDVCEEEYLNQVTKLEKQTDNRVSIFLEEELIFEEEPVSISVFQRVIQNRYNIPLKILQHLTQLTILRVEISSDGKVYYQLGSPCWVYPALKMKLIKKERKQIEVQKKFLKEYRMKMFMRFLAVFLVAIVTLSVFLIDAYSNQREEKEKVIYIKNQLKNSNDIQQRFIKSLAVRIDTSELEKVTNELDSLIYAQFKVSPDNIDQKAEIASEIYTILEIDQNFIAEAYGNLAWYQLFNHKFDKALKSAIKARGFQSRDTTILWLEENLALAYACAGDTQSARRIYLKIKDLNFAEYDIPFSVQFQNDVERLIEEKVVLPEHADKFRSYFK